MADNDVTRIAGNIGAMNALYALTNINKQLSVHQTRLATGKRINSAADDPAGLAISTKMMIRSEGLKTALSNIGDAKNLLAVAESGLGRLTDILNSMRTITEQAASDTNGTEERAIVKEQLASYATQINDIVAQTKWSDKVLIGGNYDDETAALTFQTGSDVGETTQLFGLQDMRASAMSLLRTATAAVEATISTDLGTDYTAELATLASGATAAVEGTNYTVAFSVSETTGGLVYSAQLQLAGSNVGAAVTGTYDNSAGASNIDFGNGIAVNMASDLWTAGTDAELDITAFGTDMTGAAVAVTGTNTELVSDDYSVNYTIGTDDLLTVNLMASDGTTVLLSQTATYSDTEGNVINFGNGLQVTIADSIDNSSAVSVTGDAFAYTASEAGEFTGAAVSESFSYTPAEAAVAAGVNIATSGTGGVSNASDFSGYLSIIDAAIVRVNSQLSKIGSLTGSLSFKEDQVSSSQINIEASYNRIMNANMAEEQVNASKLMILQQTSTAMLAQANAAPQFLLSLFQ